MIETAGAPSDFENFFGTRFGAGFFGAIPCQAVRMPPCRAEATWAHLFLSWFCSSFFCEGPLFWTVEKGNPRANHRFVWGGRPTSLSSRDSVPLRHARRSRLSVPFMETRMEPFASSTVPRNSGSHSTWTNFTPEFLPERFKGCW